MSTITCDIRTLGRVLVAEKFNVDLAASVMMADAGLVVNRNDGRFFTYSLSPSFKNGSTLDLRWCKIVIAV